MISITVTIAVSVFEFPFTSIAVRVTVLSPASAQEKLEISRDKLAIPQASELPASTSAGTILTDPLASSSTVMFCVSIAGAV